MAGVDEKFDNDIEEDDDEKRSLKAQQNNGGKNNDNKINNKQINDNKNDNNNNILNNPDNNENNNNNNINPSPKNKKQISSSNIINKGLNNASSPNNRDNQSSAPSLTRRMSSQLLSQVERQRSVVDNMGITDQVNRYVPDAITQHIPGLNRKASQLKLTYFCNICFTKYPIEEGFTLRQCQHQFCPDCLRGFFDNKINNGVVNLTCFYPCEGSKPCGEKIDEEDIHQIVSAETWEKYEKFKANAENTYSRQCPFCDHTQNGNPDQPIMTCEKCDKQYCLYHSNAHPPSMTCEEYELSIAKETKMNEMAIQEMGENVKPCPQCNFRILKNGGCNHMKCVKCGCSFCWLCMMIIEDEELPQHYKDPNSPCKGQQFAGMEGEPPPRWIMCILVICMALFCIPSTVMGIAFGLICFPFVCCCDRRNESGERQSLFETMFGCWLIWLIIFVVIAVFIPVIIFYIVWEVLKAIYGIFRICIPCLPPCPSGGRANNENAGGGEIRRDRDNNNNNNSPGGRGNREALLSDTEQDQNIVRNNDVVVDVGN